jgi:hypothetical protein
VRLAAIMHAIDVDHHVLSGGSLGFDGPLQKTPRLTGVAKIAANTAMSGPGRCVAPLGFIQKPCRAGQPFLRDPSVAVSGELVSEDSWSDFDFAIL